MGKEKRIFSRKNCGNQVRRDPRKRKKKKWRKPPLRIFLPVDFPKLSSLWILLEPGRKERGRKRKENKKKQRKRKEKQKGTG
jgi:hypothetical protein